MKRIMVYKQIVGIAVLFLMSILFVLTGCNGKNGTQNNQPATIAQRNVQTVAVVRKDITSGISATGRVVSDVHVNLSPVLGGKIEKIHVSEGDRVSEGQLLVELNRTQLVQAEQSFKNVEKNFERAKELLRTDVIDQKSYEEIETAYIIAKSNYEQVLENAKIKAPINGTITSISLQEGEFFNSMMYPYLIRLVSLEQMKVITNISDVNYPLVKPGTAAKITVDAYPDRVFEGKVTFISSEADMLSGTFRCEVLINDRQSLLRHNQFARVFVVTAEAKNSLIVPQSAMITDRSLFVAEDGKAVRRTVDTGISTPTEIEILTGISENEAVITIGNIGLADGFPVNIIE